MSFKNDKFENTEITAKIVSVKALEGITKEVVVECLNESVKDGWTAYSTECNNTFEKCNYSDWGTVIEIGTNIAGKSAQTAVFTNIEITSNTFTDIPSILMRVNNVNGLVFSRNTVDIGGFFDKATVQGKVYFGKYCNNVSCFDNEYIDGGFLDNKKIAQAESISVWAEVNSRL